MTAYHLHIISDSTGGTAHSIAMACMAQFDGIDVRYHNTTLVKSEDRLRNVLKRIEATPGPVFFTLIDQNHRKILEEGCRKIGTPSVSLLDQPIELLSTFFKVDAQGRAGSQHELNNEYFARIAAMDYAMACDDGQSDFNYGDADVIMVGVSRTSKTPTCMVLAQKGIKAANIPLIPNRAIAPEILKLESPFFVGLVTDPKKLVDIRTSRLAHLGQEYGTDYTNFDAIKDEIRSARRLFAENRWPVIDVSRRSIEETAAEVMNLLNRHKRQTQPVTGA